MRFHLLRKLFTVFALVLVGALAGPFGTFDALSTTDRFLYWLFAVVGVGLCMNVAFLTTLTSRRLMALPRLPLMAGASALAALPGTVLVLMIEAALRPEVAALGFRVELWGAIAIIGLVIGLSEYRTFLPALSDLPALSALNGQAGAVPIPSSEPPPPPHTPAAQSRDARQEASGRDPKTATPAETRHAAPAPAPAPADRPLFLRNLDPDLGQELVSLTTHDHYLEVVTRAGRGKILKRMADAVAELGPYPGMQIHRSHWVALDAIDRLDRDGRKMHAVLHDGRSLPVSRPNVAALAKAFEARSRG